MSYEGMAGGLGQAEEPPCPTGWTGGWAREKRVRGEIPSQPMDPRTQITEHTKTGPTGLPLRWVCNPPEVIAERQARAAQIDPEMVAAAIRVFAQGPYTIAAPVDETGAAGAIGRTIFAILLVGGVGTAAYFGLKWFRGRGKPKKRTAKNPSRCG